MIRLLVFGMLAVAGPANADGPVTARLGLALDADEVGSPLSYLPTAPSFTAGGLVELELGYKLTTTLAVTVRTSVAFHHDRDLGTARTIGLGVSYELVQPLWLAPWLGMATDSLTDSVSPNPMLAGGIDIGCDLATWGTHHLGAFFGASHGGNFHITNDPAESAGDYELAIGVSYRYW